MVFREASRDGAPPIELTDGEKLIDMLEKLVLALKPITTYEVEHGFFKDFENSSKNTTVAESNCVAHRDVDVIDFRDFSHRVVPAAVLMGLAKLGTHEPLGVCHGLAMHRGHAFSQNAKRSTLKLCGHRLGGWLPLRQW